MANELYILTVVLNPGKLLEKTLTSLYSQPFNDFKHIIVDGGSSDGWENNYDWPKWFRTSVIKIEDKGLYEGLNNAVSLVPHSNFFMFLHAGDEIVSDTYLNTASQAIINSAALDIIYSDVVFHRPTGEVFRRFSAGRFNFSKLQRGWCPPHTSLIITKRFYNEVGPHNETYLISGDYEWMIRAFRRNPNSLYVRSWSVSMLEGGLSSGKDLRLFLAKLEEDYRALKTFSSFPALVCLAKRILKIFQWMKK